MTTQAIEVDNWKALPWKKFQKTVFRLQVRIFKARKNGNHKLVRKLQKLLLNSKAAKYLAVRQVTQLNPGKATAGVDGKTALNPKERMQLAVDLTSGWKSYKFKLIDIMPVRTQEEISQVMKGWGTEVLESIKEVSIDLWKCYKNLVTKLMPKAQVVADRFHVMAQINQELDMQRKREKRKIEDLIKAAKTPEDKAKQEQALEGLKKSKYVLLKNEKNLTEKQVSKLIQVKEVSSNLKRMHELKEEIRKIFEQTNNWLTGLFKLGMWLAKAKIYFPDSQNTIIRWLDEILAYFDNRTTSGVVEGINNKLKLIKRSAYGFRNFDNYRIRCLLNWNFNY
jgi:transposase